MRGSSGKRARLERLVVLPNNSIQRGALRAAADAGRRSHSKHSFTG